ncbi:oligopeptide/dipeptide ABC transporter, ATPase subunit [Desulfofarcimen acetoxidans DSM 771]|jgi:peptide/nickel transport system ATP-binding protein|uniref:Nickel import system ATP-binding protein NikD n=1 Tax=Desulfofarcimen acetoxidans (strain ATCC 49208 / DSM 771 / KCTC 5769 / VKM B-1644 / 5575) TaxID=485916 RepID=C8W526_DESAS|nr:ABC transporter ATP-binding protein [Desulfofarcimen acetoxidans]ACV61378.1 oligopeptide/dipeptide ABC transporter, ATPase subunit [Desulfofarcimen acetoxidans DSM 771]
MTDFLAFSDTDSFRHKHAVTEPLLSIVDLKAFFKIKDTVLKALDNVSININHHEVVALVGETGCGKSVLVLSILGLLPKNACTEGSIRYLGKEILGIDEEELRGLRGKAIGMIPQNPATSLNPLMKIGIQVMEIIRLHKKCNKSAAKHETINLFSRLRLPDPTTSICCYPHQLSGGMRQRVLISMGIACNPGLILVDEPTKGLDAVLRKRVVDLLKEQVSSSTSSMLLITHDFSVAAALADRVAVMYAGEIVETGPVSQILNHSRHPYTKSLLNSLPGRGFNSIPGFSPSLTNLPPGCKFQPRCKTSSSRCAAHHPDMEEILTNHFVRCFHAHRS